MPPRPSDRGRQGTPLLSGTQSGGDISRSDYDISSPGSEDDEDDFIGTDSYEGSPEGSWDSAGKGDRDRDEPRTGVDGSHSSRTESYGDDDGFIEQDNSSGADQDESDFRRQMAERAESRSSVNARSPPDTDYAPDDKFQNLATQGISGVGLPPSSDDVSNPGSEAERPVDAPTPLRRDAPSDEQYEDDNDHVSKDNSLADDDLEETSGRKKHRDASSVQIVADKGMGGGRVGSSAIGLSAGDSSGPSNARAFDSQSYMQSRLSLHLLSADDSQDEEDEEETPRLPSLSARAREREQEKELLELRAKDSQCVSEAAPSPDRDASTPRLDGRNSTSDREHEDKALSRKLLEQDGVSSRQSAEFGTNVEVHVGDGFENLVAQIVVRAILDAGGYLPPDFGVNHTQVNRRTSAAARDDTETDDRGAETARLEMENLRKPDDCRHIPVHAMVGSKKGISTREGAQNVMSQDLRPDMADKTDEVVDKEMEEEEGALDLARETFSSKIASSHRSDGMHDDTQHGGARLQAVVKSDPYLSGFESDRSFTAVSGKSKDTNAAVTFQSVREGKGPATGARRREQGTQVKHQTRIQMRNTGRLAPHEAHTASQDLPRQRSRTSSSDQTSAENLGRKDWNFETVKFSRSQKEKLRYESPPAIPGSKWIRVSVVAPGRSKDRRRSLSADMSQTSVNSNASLQQGVIAPEDSKLSASARAREYWANNVQTKRSKTLHAGMRPRTSISSIDLDSESGIDEATSSGDRRFGTNSGYVARFRYNLQGTRGGKFGEEKRKDDVDWKIRDAATKPGAGDYDILRDNSLPSTGGTIHDRAAWEVKRERESTPAPGQYDRDVDRPVRARGGRFGSGNRWQATEVFEQRSRELPGPSEYDAGEARDMAYQRVCGGVISEANPMSELDWTLLRGSRTPGPSTYDLPPLDITQQRPKGGKMGRDARLKPIFSTALHGPGPGSYFHQRKADVEKEIAAKRNLSRISIASSRSRLSLSRERSREIAQSLAPKGGTRRTFLDDAQLHASRLPGPGSYTPLAHTVEFKASLQPMERHAEISLPGTSDPVVYSIGQAERSSILSDYKTIHVLQKSWAHSAHEFKALLDSFISSRVQADSSQFSMASEEVHASMLASSSTVAQHDYMAIDSPTFD